MSQQPPIDDRTANKHQLRLRFKQKRAGVPSETRPQLHRRIAQHLDTLFTQRNDAQHIAIYLASPLEADLQPWFERAWAVGKMLYSPVIGESAGDMEFYPLTSDTVIHSGRFGLREPVIVSAESRIKAQNLDAALLPLLAFDDQGNRLGMGGGYYDRYFAREAQRPIIVGIGYEVQRSATTLPTQPWDIRLNSVVTELGLQNIAAGA